LTETGITDEELALLEQWIHADTRRIITVCGIGGIGKTALAAKVAMQMHGRFTYIFWRSLQNAPPLEHILQDWLQFVSDQRRAVIPKESDEQISLLLHYLNEYTDVSDSDEWHQYLWFDRSGQRPMRYAKT
jgi:hypothetical protein